MKCDDYDYIEIACMHHYPLRLKLRQNLEVEGIALDTHIDDRRQECLKLRTGTDIESIVLDDIKTITVCIDNPHFQTILFRP